MHCRRSPWTLRSFVPVWRCGRFGDQCVLAQRIAPVKPEASTIRTKPTNSAETLPYVVQLHWPWRNRLKRHSSESWPQMEIEKIYISYKMFDLASRKPDFQPSCSLDAG